MNTWKTFKRELVFAAEPYIEISRQSVDIGNGKTIDDFFQVHLRPFALAVPVLECGKVLVIRQYKHGPGRISLTFPAGFVEQGEDPEVACRRELREETGFVAARVTHLGEYVDNGNQRGCVGNYYLCTQCTRQQLPESGDLEEMDILEMTVGQIDDAMSKGEFAIVHHAAAWAFAKFHWLSTKHAHS